VSSVNHACRTTTCFVPEQTLVTAEHMSKGCVRLMHHALVLPNSLTGPQHAKCAVACRPCHCRGRLRYLSEGHVICATLCALYVAKPSCRTTTCRRCWSLQAMPLLREAVLLVRRVCDLCNSSCTVCCHTLLQDHNMQKVLELAGHATAETGCATSQKDV
jgi:hypothetical protein